VPQGRLKVPAGLESRYLFADAAYKEQKSGLKNNKTGGGK